MYHYKIIKQFIQTAKEEQRVQMEDGAISIFEEEYRIHLFYEGLNEEIIQLMKESHKYPIPESLLAFWRITNGADLFWMKRCYEGIEITREMVSFFGYHEYGVDKEQPYDIQVEDLSKPKHCKNDWLKIGAMDLVEDLSRVEIYMDPKSADEKVFAYYQEKKKLYKEWNSLEECIEDIVSIYTESV